MDLRIERTRKCIKDAFIELRKNKPIEKITVKELAALASINKATFYSHYTDIYDLSEQLEEEIISSIVANIPHINCLISNPTIAVDELTYALIQSKEITDILFSGNRNGLYGIRLENSIKKEIFHLYPQYQDDLQWNMVLTFLIHGGIYSFPSYFHKNPTKAREILCELNTCVKEHFFKDKQSNTADK